MMMAPSPRPAGGLALLLAGLALACGEDTAASADGGHDAPTIPAGFVLEPTFRMGEDKIRGGHAFAARLGPALPTVVVTALHLVGRAGGLDHDVPSDELPDRLDVVLLRDGFAPDRVIATAETVLALPRAAVVGNDSPVGDVAAFVPASARDLSPRPFARTTPRRGDIVWLAASLPGADPGRMAHPARVRKLQDGLLVYTFLDADLDLAGANGAPVVDERGDVVAIHLLTERKTEDRLQGMGNPVTAFVTALRAAVRGGD